MACLAQTQELEALKPKLINKEQLNTIIINKNGSPDYLAINIYYDTMRSWYNPNIGYQKNGNILHINKLKTKGIFLNYTRLAEIHGCSKETMRQKIVKLEQLGLVHRSFQHKETATTKSYNQLIAYVWKDTPHFYNPFGIEFNQVSELIPQTNHVYIEKRYGVNFAKNAPHNQAFLTGGGIQVCLDTKELNNLISNDIRSSTQVLESNFSKNSKIGDIKTSELVEVEKEEVVGSKRDYSNLGTQQKPLPIGIQSKYRIPNKRKKPTNSEKKAKVFYFKQYKEPKDLAYHYPLNNDDCTKLQSKCGRPFTLNAMNEILLDMSKRLDRTFKSKTQFIYYFGKCLSGEKRDAVQTDNINFKIKANITEEDRNYAKRESFLSRAECKAYDLENRTTDGFQSLSTLGILEKIIN